MKTKAMSKMYIKRALRTFCQTAVGYIAVNIAMLDFTVDKQILKTTLFGLATSAVAGGIAAVMNYKEEEK